MSTYHPKTLKRWKAHKQSLLDLHERPARIPIDKSQVIHSLEVDPQAPTPPYPLKRQRYRLEDPRNRSVYFSNGFRRLRKDSSRLAFSKVISEDCIIRVDFANETSNTDKIAVNNCLPRMLPKCKKLLIRRQVRKHGATNSTLRDLIQVKQPSQVQPLEVLQTDGEQSNLLMLEEEGFSPYRAPKPSKNDEEPPLITRPIHNRPCMIDKQKGRKRWEDLTSDSIHNFMSISQIDLKQKKGMKLVRGKKRSFSVMDIKENRRLESKSGNTRYNRRINSEIQPWQTDK